VIGRSGTGCDLVEREAERDAEQQEHRQCVGEPGPDDDEGGGDRSRRRSSAANGTLAALRGIHGIERTKPSAFTSPAECTDRAKEREVGADQQQRRAIWTEPVVRSTGRQRPAPSRIGNKARWKSAPGDLDDG
jgi:hypothetical protein